MRIQAVGLGCLGKAVHHGTGIGTRRCIAEQPVLPTHHERVSQRYSGFALRYAADTNRILSNIVIGGNLGILQIFDNPCVLILSVTVNLTRPEIV